MTGYRLVAIDLDGTLLNPEGQIPEYASKRIAELVEEGVTVVVNTGRMANTVFRCVSEIGAPVSFIAYNGAIVASNDSETYRFLTAESVRKIAAFCKRHGLYMQTYGQATIYALEQCRELERDPDLKYSKFVKVDDFEHYKGLGTPKVLCVRFGDDIDAISDEMSKEFPELNIYKSTPECIEVTAKDVNKGRALEVFCEIMGIPREETVAIGDSKNDIPMVQWAGLGVAVNNADPMLKDCADLVTDAGFTDGVMETLDHLFPPRA